MKFIIGDTSQQLAVCATADAMMIDGKIVTKADYLALAAQLVTVKESGGTGQSPCAKFCESVALNKDFHRLRERVTELEQKNAELAAQVEALSILCLAYSKNEPLPKLSKELFEPCFKAEKYLNQIKAEAVEKSVDWLHSNYPHLANPVCGLLTHYAERVKAGEV